MFAVLFLSSSAVHIFAQKKVEDREVIVVEFLIPNRIHPGKTEIPINDDGEFGQVSISECGFPGKCPGHVYSTYTLSAKASSKVESKTKVNFKIEVTDGCKTQKAFTVYRMQQTKIQLKCGVSLVAYYGFESKEGN